jgi:hypothetical protein
MGILERHPRADLLRYLDDTVEGAEKGSLEEHLQGCPECREYLSFVKGFNQGLSGLSKEEFTTDETCPDSWTLVSYEAGSADEETARHLRAHLLFCDKCAEEFYVLRRLRGPSWTEVIVRAVGGAIECLSLSGSGILVEPAYAAVRTAERPVAGGVEIEDTVADPATKATSTLRVIIETDPRAPATSVTLDADPPQPDWKVYLLDAEERELASAPIFERQTRIGSRLPYGSYTISVRRGPDALANFAIEIREA